MTPVLVAAAVLAATIGVAACGDDGGGGGEASFDLKIGDIVPLTGDLSPFGPPGRKAADLAVQEIRKAIKQAGVAHTVSIREQVVQISPSSTAASIRDIDDDGYLNRTAPPDNLQAKALADHVADSLGGASGKTVNVGARNDFYGTGLADAFPREWQARGGRIGQKVVYDPELPSYNSEARKIASGNPDAFVIVDFPETYTKVGAALVRTGDWDATKTFITDGLADTELPKTAGDEATEGLRGTTV